LGRTDTVARADAEATGVDRLALISRHDGRVVAVASYDGLREPGVAEVAFAVADDDQRRGIGMRMLEQLAAIAADRGIHRFDAEVMFGNRAMLEVFEQAGFAVRRRGSFDELTVSLDITPTEALLERIGERDHLAAIAALRPVLAPSSVAVVGAAATPGNVGAAVTSSPAAAMTTSSGATSSSARPRAACIEHTTPPARWTGVTTPSKPPAMMFASSSNSPPRRPRRRHERCSFYPLVLSRKGVRRPRPERSSY
jgi:GNAT superfamily N-acetyltransferase